MHEALELAVGLGDGVDLRVRPELVRVRVVVGQRQEHEVEEIPFDHEGPDAAGVPVAYPRHAELGAAGRLARGEHVGVEKLAGDP